MIDPRALDKLNALFKDIAPLPWELIESEHIATIISRTPRRAWDLIEINYLDCDRDEVCLSKEDLRFITAVVNMWPSIYKELRSTVRTRREGVEL